MYPPTPEPTKLPPDDKVTIHPWAGGKPGAYFIGARVRIPWDTAVGFLRRLFKRPLKTDDQRRDSEGQVR